MTLRVARIGTMTQPVPATEYGGIQRSMAQMTAFQAAICAHDVWVYASADSAIVSFTKDIADKLGLEAKTSEDGCAVTIKTAEGRVGRVILRHMGVDSIGYENPDEKNIQADLFGLFLCDEKRAPFSVIHSHYAGITSNDLLPRGLGHKTLTHQHTGTLPDSYPEKRFPLVCISDSQAALLQEKYNANVAAVIPHGLDSFTHDFSAQSAGYAAWIGRFLENKGAHRAIEIARKANMPLVMAGMVYDKKPKSALYFQNDVAPHIDITDTTLLTRMAGMTPTEAAHEMARLVAQSGKPNPVIFVGAANDSQKQALYGNAAATLFPIAWPEPFGRVMIESMACGTPVIANRRVGTIDCGAVADVIDEGVTGTMITAANYDDSIAQAVTALTGLRHFDRAEVRRVFDEKWTSERVARQIAALYASVPNAAPLHKPPVYAF